MACGHNALQPGGGKFGKQHDGTIWMDKELDAITGGQMEMLPDRFGDGGLAFAGER